MVACKALGEYKRNQKKIERFCLEETVKQAKVQNEEAKQASSRPFEASMSSQQNPVNRQLMRYDRVAVFARGNQKAQKRPRTKRQSKQPTKTVAYHEQQRMTITKNSPGTLKRPQCSAEDLKQVRRKNLKRSQKRQLSDNSK